VAERWAVNASPLIALGRIGRLHLLSTLAEEVVVPEAVAEEVRRIGTSSLHCRAQASISRPS
jgi:predicted nucleic acid-binding protein